MSNATQILTAVERGEPQAADQLLQLVYREQLIVRLRGREVPPLKINPLVRATMTLRAPPPGAIDQDAAHRLRRGGKEVGSIGEGRILRSH